MVATLSKLSKKRSVDRGVDTGTGTRTGTGTQTGTGTKGTESKPFAIHSLYLYDLDANVSNGTQPLANAKWHRIHQWVERIKQSDSLARGRTRTRTRTCTCTITNSDLNNPEWKLCLVGIACQLHNDLNDSNIGYWYLERMSSLSTRDSREEWRYSLDLFDSECDWFGLSRVQVYFTYSEEDPLVKKTELVSFKDFLYTLNDKFRLSPEQTAYALSICLHPARGAAVDMKGLLKVASSGNASD